MSSSWIRTLLLLVLVVALCSSLYQVVLVPVLVHAHVPSPFGDVKVQGERPLVRRLIGHSNAVRGRQMEDLVGRDFWIVGDAGKGAVGEGNHRKAAFL